MSKVCSKLKVGLLGLDVTKEVGDVEGDDNTMDAYSYLRCRLGRKIAFELLIRLLYLSSTKEVKWKSKARRKSMAIKPETTKTISKPGAHLEKETHTVEYSGKKGASKRLARPNSAQNASERRICNDLNSSVFHVKNMTTNRYMVDQKTYDSKSVR